MKEKDDTHQYGWQSLGFNSYFEYVNSPHWKRTCDIMLKKFDECYFCKTKENLVVHHKSYEHCPQEKSTELLVICFKCHKKIHKRGRDDRQKN